MEQQEAHTSPSPLTKAQIADWLTEYIANLRGMKRDQVKPTVTFDRFGLDSASAVQMSGDLMDWLQCDIDPSILYDYSTIDTLAGYLTTLPRD